ncbi:hypothetical protein EC988_001118 [Linderina pennispora]|nr:hypothetical protein EC988_001118 [Linderina pennispora]
MSHDEVGGADKKSFSSKLFNMFTGIADQGFRMYTPIGDINDYDEDEEEQRREYILRVEEYTKNLADAMSNMHTQEEVLDKGVVKVTMAIENAFRSESMAPYDDGSVTKPEGEDHERLTVSLGLLQNAAESNYWSNREVAVWKDFNFADTVMEYRTMLGGIKEVMNNATQTLIMYERAMQRQQGYSAKANNLRVQYPSDTPSVKYANEQEILAERELDLARQEYTDSCDMVKHELVRYERERAAGMCRALEHTAMLELESAKARMQELRAACRRIKNLQLVKDPPHARTSIGPMLWHGTAAGQATAPITANTSLPSSLPTLMTPGSQPSFSDNVILGGLSNDSRGASRNSPLAARLDSDDDISAFAHSNANGSSSSRASLAGALGGSKPTMLRRARTMDGPLYVSQDLYISKNGRPSSSTSGLEASGTQSAVSQRPKWNGRISNMPYQGYDPAADLQYRPALNRDRLAEMEVEAEVEDELLRSGLLTQRQITRRKTTQNQFVSSPDGYSPGHDIPPVLPAFRTSTSASSSNHHRHTNSDYGVLTIPNSVSASAYLKYSRETLSASLSASGGSASSSGTRSLPATTNRAGSPGPSRSTVRNPTHHHMLRRGFKDKGKGKAAAV